MVAVFLFELRHVQQFLGAARGDVVVCAEMARMWQRATERLCSRYNLSDDLRRFVRVLEFRTQKVRKLFADFLTVVITPIPHRFGRAIVGGGAADFVVARFFG